MSLAKSFFSASVVKPSAGTAAFVLRVSLGAVLLAHGLFKLLAFGLDGTTGFFASVGLPAWLVIPVFAIELIGGALIALGLWVRPLALLAAALLLGTVWVHSHNGWLFYAPNGGWEYPLYLTVTALAVALAGEGAWAIRIPQRTDAQAAAASPAALAQP